MSQPKKGEKIPNLGFDQSYHGICRKKAINPRKIAVNMK